MTLLIIMGLAFAWTMFTSLTPASLRSVNIGMLLVAVVMILVLESLQLPGYALGTYLLLGLLLSAIPNGSGRIALLPLIGFLLPFVFVTAGQGFLEVDSPWFAAAILSASAAVGCVMRAAWTQREKSASSGARWLVTVGLALPILTVLAISTPWHGMQAWNMLLPMESIHGVGAQLVVVDDNTLRAWPWLEPLQFGFFAAMVMFFLVVATGFFARDGEGVSRISLRLSAIIALIIGVIVIVLTPGALTPLTHIDPVKVVEAIRPPFVPHDAITYLSPETDRWMLSRGGLAVWGGMTTYIATLAWVVATPRDKRSASSTIHPAWATGLFVASGLFFAEALTHQAGHVVRDTGAQGYVFALAALSTGSLLMRGRLRIVFIVLSAALSCTWLMLFLSERVLG